jgi:hypothetical protein
MPLKSEALIYSTRHTGTGTGTGQNTELLFHPHFSPDLGSCKHRARLAQLQPALPVPMFTVYPILIRFARFAVHLRRSAVLQDPGTARPPQFR